MNFKYKLHLEIINLIIPDENDKETDIRKLCQYIASISTDIPLHFSKFFPRYKMADKKITPNETLVLAKEIAYESGMKFVYIGNSEIKNSENTYCPSCKGLLIERKKYHIINNNLEQKNGGTCPYCNNKVNIIM